MGVPVNKTFRRHFSDSKRLRILKSEIKKCISETLSPVATAGCVLDIVRFVESHYIERDGTQECAIRTACIGLKVGVCSDHNVPWDYSSACETC